MSLNLSFKEWPFLSINENLPNNPSKPQAIKEEETDSFNFNFSLLSSDYSHIKSLLHSFIPMTNDENVSNIENYPINYQLSSWGSCGLLACTFESSLAIFSNDFKGCLTPILMFSPFEKYSFGKINKQPSNSSMITAISWANGHLEPYLPKPVLAVGSEKGNIILYNVKSRNILNSFNFNEPISSILWSSFKINRFYVGTSTGHFYICEVYKKTIEIIKMFDFSENSAIISENILYPVDFIVQDDVDGYTVALASKTGMIGVITNLRDPSQSQLRLFQNLNFLKSGGKVYFNFVEFYPNNQNYILVSTHNSTFIISIVKSVLIPLINRPNIRFISVVESEKDTVIVGDHESVNVWRINDHSWVHVDEMRIARISTFSKHENTILLTTSSNWINFIEYRRKKLFVTKRIKLNINGKPIDYDFGDGSIAFLANRNSICLTEKTPESVSLSKFGEERQEVSDESARGNSNSISFSFNILPKNENLKIKHVGWISSSKLVAWCEKSIFLVDLQTRKISEPLKKYFDKLSNSITQLFFSKSRKFIGLILNHEQVYFLDTRSNLNIVYSIDFNEIFNGNGQCLFGSISPSEDKVVFASQSSLFFADLNKKEKLKQVQSSLKFNASFVSWNEEGIVIGTEKGSAFIIKSKNPESLSEIGKKEISVIYDSLHIDEYGQNKLGPIQTIHQNANKSYVILDNNGQGILVSNDVVSIAENIENIKQCSNETYLVCLKDYNKLIAINAFDEFLPRLPPSFYLLQKNNISFYSSKSELLGMFKEREKNKSVIDSIRRRIFTTNETNYSISFRNTVCLLVHILSFHHSFNSLTSKAYLKLGNLEKAKNILLKSGRNDKEHLNNLLIAAFYGSNAESAKPVVKNLLSNNMIFDAVDILLITNDVHSAAEVLFEAGKIKDAYYALMLRDGEKDSEKEKEKELARKVAMSFIEKKENVLFGLKLLSSFGYVQEMLDQLSLCLS